jgi:phytoene dehydrogenase-like protein
VVVGGGIAGLAAAARLAKRGHLVELFEATDRLGGSWAPFEFQGHLVDRAPSVLTFPAPWRDLFRKSGRPLEAELARIGAALEPAPPARYVFADGSGLLLPTDRGEQVAMLGSAYGASAAARWRDLVDDLDRVWQLVRPLGLESELKGPAQLKPVKKALQARQTIKDLADQLGEPHLSAMVSSVAYRLGSVPRLTPSWCAVDLSVTRTFGRWTITSDDSRHTGRSSVLVDVLASRLGLRKVVMHLERRVQTLVIQRGRVTGVVTDDGAVVPAAAVVSTIDPWQTYGDLWPGRPTLRLRWARARWKPALAPTVTHAVSPIRRSEVGETVVLSSEGVPRVTFSRPTGDGTLHTVHDYERSEPARSAGIAWSGFDSWLERPKVSGGVDGLYLAGPFSPGGSGPSAQVLSGALASYACHDDLG